MQDLYMIIFLVYLFFFESKSNLIRGWYSIISGLIIGTCSELIASQKEIKLAVAFSFIYFLVGIYILIKNKEENPNEIS